VKNKPLIVLTEDNAADVFLIRSALQDAGLDFRLHVISDGEQALRFLQNVEADQSACPDLLLLDLNLPKLSGADILRNLRENNQCSASSVVVLTSSDSPQDRARVAQLGVEHYFLKTASLDEFMKLGSLVRQVLEDREG
jgi:DNA-binding response OmpR family regulator